MCQPRGVQRSFEACGCGCAPFFRRFISAKEEQDGLGEYRDQLKKELEGVEERIQEN